LAQTTYTWNYSDQGGAWSEPTNWSPTGYPNGSDHIAKFTLGLTAHRSISMSENITLNQILSTNTNNSYRLEIGSAGYTLTFAGTNPTVDVRHVSGGDAGVWINALVDVGTAGLKSIGPGTYTVRFAGGIQGSGTITVDTNSGIELTGNSPNFSGDFVVNNGGVLAARTNQSNVLGNTTGKTIVNQGGLVWFRDLGNPTISEAFILNGVRSRGSLQCYASNVTLNGPITLNANGSFSVQDWASGEPGNTRTFTINSVIDDGDNTYSVFFLGDFVSHRWTNSRKSVIVLGAQNTYGGNTYITSNYHDAANPLTGNVRLAINNALPTTTKVILGGSHDAGSGVYIGVNEGNGKLILNGYSQTLAGLETAGTGTANRVVGGSSTTSTLTLNIADTVTNTYAGYLGGPDTNEDNLALVKTGLGTLVLSAANTYTGATDVQAGVLRITHAQALGSTSAGTTVANYASVEVQGGITVNEPISLTGGGYPQATPWYGALRSTGGNNTWAGPITVSGGTRIGVRTNETFTITGGITGSGVLMFSGTASGTIRIANTPINIGGWNLVANDNTTTLLDVAGNTWGNTYISYGGTLKLGVDNAMPSATVVYIGTASPDTNGALDLNGHSQTIGGLTDAGSGTRQVINSGASASTLTISNTSDYTYAGVITGNINLVKQGTGTQTLSGNNDYTGTTTVQAGTLRLGHNNALGATTAGTTVKANARLDLNGCTISEPISLEGGTLTNSSTTAHAYVNGVLTLASGGTSNIIDTPTSMSVYLQGQITGPGGFTKTGGAAAVRLANPANDYQGPTVISQGYLDNYASEVIPDGSPMTVNAYWNLRGYTETIHSLSGGANGYIYSSQGAGVLRIGAGNADATYAGRLRAHAGTLSIVKIGTGTQTLSGNNDYTGTTDVQAGTLALAHTSNNNISGSSAIRVAAGATLDVTGLASSLLRLASGQTLQGNGTVQGSVEAPAGSFLGAGMSPGHLTISSNYTQAGTLVVELAGYTQGGTQELPGQWAANGYDWVSVGGQAVLDGYVDIRLLAGFQPRSGDKFNVLTAAGGITDQGLELLWEAGSLLPAQYWSYQIVPGQGNERILQLQLGVPEPASLVLLALGAVGLLLTRRFLARKSTT